MKIVMTGEMSGTRNGEDWPERGTLVDLPEDEAQTLVRNGMAREHGTKDGDDALELAAFGGAVETAAVEPVTETAADTSKPRGR